MQVSIENILKPKGMLYNPNFVYSQIFGIQCEHYYDCSHKETMLISYIFSLLPHVFTTNGESGSSKLPTNT